MQLTARSGPSAIATIRVTADANIVSVYSSGEDRNLDRNCTIMRLMHDIAKKNTEATLRHKKLD